MSSCATKQLTCWSVAGGEWITHIPLVTDTDRNMVPDRTVRVDAAQAGTRILALAVDTGLVLRTVRVDDALGTAVGRRADHFWQTRALATVADNSWWVGVGPAGVGVARIIRYDWQDSWKKGKLI